MPESSSLPAGASCTVGWAAQRWGGRLVSSLNLCGNTLLLVLPVAARHGAGALSICLCAIGLCQGPLVPSVAVLQRAWLPPATDPLRAWIIRFISIGGRLARITAVAVTMPMALKFGWQSIAYLYGSAAAVSAVLSGCAAVVPYTQSSGLLLQRQSFRLCNYRRLAPATALRHSDARSLPVHVDDRGYTSTTGMKCKLL